MPHRRFRDLFGREWDVWEVVPTGLTEAQDGMSDGDVESADHRPLRSVLPEQLREGWLAFQWDSERRRFAPVPPRWVSLDDSELQLLLERAAPAVKPRRLIE